MQFVALVTIVDSTNEELAVDIAKEAGAGSVTIVAGRNIGLKEKKTFFGLTLEENVSVLLFLLPKRLSMKVLKAINKNLKLDSNSGSGFAFTVPLSHVAGLDKSEIHKFESSINDML